MSEQKVDSQDNLQALSQGYLNMLDVLQHMAKGTLEESGLDPKTFMLVRMAALATLDAAPGSWLLNIEAGSEAGLTPESILGTLIAIAPVIGTARVVSAADNFTKALELAQNGG